MKARMDLDARIRAALIFGPLIMAGCSGSTGGTPQSPGASQQTSTKAPAGTTLGPNQDSAESAGEGPSGSSGQASTDTVSHAGATSSDGNTDPNTSAASAGGPSDTELCALIAAQGAAVTQHFDEAQQFLCQKGGFASLRAQSGQLQQLQSTTDGTGVSHFTLAEANLISGTPAGADKLAQIFCSSFAQYKSELGSAAFANIDSITPSNAGPAGCDFDFKSTSVLFSQPEYIGHQSHSVSSNQASAISLSYLTRSVSTVVDSTTMSIAAKYQGKLYTYTVLTSVAPTSGFASIVLQELISGTNASLSGSATAIAQLSK